MSFKESDSSNIIKILSWLDKTYNNPGLSKKLIELTFKTYETIPIYPGIVANTLLKMLEKKDANKLKKNDWIAFEYNNKKFTGRIKKIQNNKIHLKNVTEITIQNSLTLDINKLKKVLKVNEAQLKKDWPMLIFGENKNANKNS